MTIEHLNGRLTELNEKCRVCSGDVFGHAGNIKMPLCKDHFVKLMQMACFYGDESGPYEGTDEEWDAVREIIKSN